MGAKSGRFRTAHEINAWVVYDIRFNEDVASFATRQEARDHAKTLNAPEDQSCEAAMPQKSWWGDAE